MDRPTPAALAKAALRRLAAARLEPTPENYTRAYAEEAGEPAAPAAEAAVLDELREVREALLGQGAAWVAVLERVARGLERGGRQWTAARRKDALHRVLAGSRSDTQRLLQRLQSLLSAWDEDSPADPAQTGLDEADLDAGGPDLPAMAQWAPLAAELNATLGSALAAPDPRAGELADQLARLADAVAAEGATPALLAQTAQACQQARRWFGQRHQAVERLAALCRELSAGLAELVEDDSWTQGEVRGLRAQLGSAWTDPDDAGLAGGGATLPGARELRDATLRLAQVRERQRAVQHERRAAREALRALLQQMVEQVDEIGRETGRFEAATQARLEAIERADSLASLAELVRTLLAEGRSLSGALSRWRERLFADRDRAQMLEARVRELEAELRRAADEVETDALTQAANRRGLTRQFDIEAARCQRDSAAAPRLAVGLLDIDNFKRLNDRLGHAAGDRALQALVQAVRERLRPGDPLGRWGGEEFVVLLPGQDADEAQGTLTRLQRGLTEALFLHEGREVFVTFSAGVTAWRSGETLEQAVARADEALYEAKRTGKNRTCVA